MYALRRRYAGLIIECNVLGYLSVFFDKELGSMSCVHQTFSYARKRFIMVNNAAVF